MQWPGRLVGVLVVSMLTVAPVWGQEPVIETSSAGTEVSIELKDASLKDILKMFSEQTGINVIASQEVADQRLTLYLDRVSPLDAFDQILRASNLTYQRVPESQIYIVKPKPVEAPEVTTVTKVYRLKFARVSQSRLAQAAEALGSITPFEGAQAGVGPGGAGGTGGVGRAGGVGGVGGAGGAGREVGIDQVIEGLLTEHGKVKVDGRTNSLIVTDVPTNFPRIEAALAALDVRTPQILIEAELLETTLSKIKDLGIEWGTGTEGTLLTLTPGQRATRFPFGFLSGKQDLVKPEGGSFPDFTRSGQIALGTIDASQIQALLQALETDSETKILARPKVLTLDNESAVIRLIRQQAVAVRTTVVAETGLTEKTPERVPTGVLLVVTPQVNQDGFITMLIEPSVTKTIVSEIASDIVDPKTRSVRALVRIRDANTLVLGGLIDRSEQESLRQVPILSGIPIVGEAFKNKEISDSASELLVFITPRIVEMGTAGGPMQVGMAPFPAREQEVSPSRKQVIEETLRQLEQPPL